MAAQAVVVALVHSTLQPFVMLGHVLGLAAGMGFLLLLLPRVGVVVAVVSVVVRVVWGDGLLRLAVRSISMVVGFGKLAWVPWSCVLQ